VTGVVPVLNSIASSFWTPLIATMSAVGIEFRSSSRRNLEMARTFASFLIRWCPDPPMLIRWIVVQLSRSPTGVAADLRRTV
jgi:hypothetical protein